jgi:hypothetical protein
MNQFEPITRNPLSPWESIRTTELKGRRTSPDGYTYPHLRHSERSRGIPCH